MYLLPFFFQTPVHLSLDFTKPGVGVSSTLYGHMTEEINYSYDGGLYAELVRNRAFRNDSEHPTSWTAVGEGATIALQKTGGVSPSLPVSLRVRGGVANEGYWGMPIRPSTTYRLSLWAKADAAGKIDASLESRDGSTTFARATINGLGGAWRKFDAVLSTSGTVKPTKDARYASTIDLLDEMAINGVKAFALVDILPQENELVEKIERTNGLR